MHPPTTKKFFVFAMIRIGLNFAYWYILLNRGCEAEVVILWWLQKARRHTVAIHFSPFPLFLHLAVPHRASQMWWDAFCSTAVWGVPAPIWQMCPFVLLRSNHCQKCPPWWPITIANFEFRMLSCAIHEQLFSSLAARYVSSHNNCLQWGS